MADYYKTLGVTKNASDKELKTAFRKLAAKHHPDAGGDAEKFKEINEAYATLKDPKKRQNYDQFGTAEPQQSQQNPFTYSNFNFNGNPAEFTDIFGSFFAEGFGQPKRRQNKNISIKYTIEFENIFNGVGNTITYQLPSGKQEVIDVRIPAGVKNGDSVRVQGYGDNSIQGLPRGDLIIKIKVKNIPGWSRDGDNLYNTQKVSIFDLMTGTTINITTPENKNFALSIPKNTNPDTTFSINGHGVPNVNNNRRGNIYIKIKAHMPKLTDEQLERIKEIKNGTSNSTE